ncbi:BnaC01g19360D [Brassica napus]|uniref:BnaC01g19360D protein n=1 Tax=Brassica napus TaxID=3708 RepID=A0A078GVU8_BRANA|nr:BnaC01g19360D [Brassica napus]
MECLSPFLGEILRPMCDSMCSRVVNAIRFKSNVQALNSVMERLVELKGNINEDHKDKPFRLKIMGWQRNAEEVITKARSKLEERVSKLVTILNEARMLEKEGLDLLDMIAAATAHERVEHVPGVSVLHQTTASNMLGKIIDGLRSSEVQKIGIWGMGGVGKTTLVRTLNNKLHEETATQPFGLVIFATPSKDFDPRTVQKQIAERLDIDTRLGETVERLARRIYVRLEKENNFLLILDDVWKDIDLDLLGIPRTEEKKGSKIILTSRFLEVCRSMRTDLDVRVDCLCEEEAWELFCQNAGEPNVMLWEHALNQLSRSVPWIKSIEEKIYQPLKLSYDFLEGQAKSCFLLCALFPEDYSIEVTELVMYWIAEGFMEEQGLQEIRQDKFSPSLRWVSLMNNKPERLPRLPEEYCMEASTLLLQENYLLQEASDGFLQAFPALRILNLKTLSKLELLDLHGSRIKEFPKGLEKLESFKHLDLSGTVHLKTIPARIVSRLSSLETLNMKLSNYHWSVKGEEQEGQATVEEIAYLDCLQRTLAISGLNLSQVSMEWLLACTTSVILNSCQGLQGMMKKLVTGSKTFVNLKSLTIVKTSINSSGGGIEKATSKGSSTSPDTLPFLEELGLHEVNFVSLSELQAQLWLRLVALKLLLVSKCNNLKTLVEIDMFTMPNLEEIEISDCNSLHNLRQTIDGPQEPLLPKLRVMKLRNLPELESVCYEKETWECLEQVKVMNCGRLYTLPISSKTCGRIKEIKGTISWWKHLRWDDPSTLETLDPCFKPLRLLGEEMAPIFGEHYLWDS